MKRSQIKIIPKYYQTYVNHIPDVELTEALTKYGSQYYLSAKDIERIGDKVYADGKWSVKTILQHIIDAERVFSYRALRFARNDKTELPGFEENNYAITSDADNRSFDKILDELINIRSSTIKLFESFDDTMLERSGTASNAEISVLAIGFVIAGHGVHHMEVIKEKYFPLI